MAPTTNTSGWKAGNPMAHPESGDEIVISGISGTFPESDSVVELRDNLFNKADLITCDTRRWDVSIADVPPRSGKINNLNKFDASFFGVHSKQAHVMDPMGRILLEKTYEAIFDAGINPKDLRDTKTGVFIGTCNSESEKTSIYDAVRADGFGIVGCSRAMFSNRISYWLGVTGPSYTIDTACSSSLYALEHAYRAIRDGHCDAAIVGGCNLCLHPFVTLQFYRLGVLSDDGKCKSFDNEANGYARSEGVVVVFLQKAKDSKRVYTRIVHAKTNCDGYKPQGITYPAGNIQKLLLDDFYKECCIPPYSLEYVEAHGTGTRVGDPEELNAIEEVFCKDRSGSLLIGSIKSNLGHTEPVSGLCAIAKMIIAYETGYIAPNLHYSVPREGIPALTNGKMKVITEKTQWNKGLSGVNSFGFGGANAHVLLKKFEKEKVNQGIPTDDLPRLICASGRTESAVAKIFDDLESKTVDTEQVGLLHAFYNQHISGHIVRGYTLLESTPTKSVCLGREIQHFSGERRPVWFVYSGMGSQWAGMGVQLMRIPVFAAAIEKCHKVLERKGVNLKKIITDPDPKIFDNIMNSIVGISAIQIGLTDILKTIGIEPDYLIGHSLGELGCAYADGGLTAEQMILSAHCRGVASIECKPMKGTMAAVGLGYNQIKSMCPPEIEVACHNGPDSCTLSGPAEAMSSFVATLTSKGIFAKEVPSSNIAFHSRYISKAGPIILKGMKEIIPTPKSRSDRWVSTSIPESQWKEPKSQLCSAEYHTNNVLSPVLFEEASRLIHNNAITIEVAPHGLLQAILRRSLKKEAIKVAITKRGDKDNVNVLLNAIGKLYQYGLNPELANIYPKVEFPVSVGTPMMSHLVEWDHSEDWFVSTYKAKEKMTSGERSVKFSICHVESEFMAGHVVNGRNLYPATGYLVMVWETLGLMMDKLYTQQPVIFENVRFQRATNIAKTDELHFNIVIQKGSGNFEIMEKGAAIVTGKVYPKKDEGKDYRPLPPVPENADPNAEQLLTKDFYKELRLRGYQYSGLFRGVKSCNLEGTRGHLTWVNNWVTFMDCMLQTMLIGKDTRNLVVPTRFEKISIDPIVHYNAILKNDLDEREQSLEVNVYPELDIIRSGGIEIRGCHASPITRKLPLDVPVLAKYVFVPNRTSEIMMNTAIRVNLQIVLENVQALKVKALEYVDEEYKTHSLAPLMEKVATVLGDMPMVQTDLLVISKEAVEMPSNIRVENIEISEETNHVVFIGANLLQRPKVLQLALGTLKKKCFIMSRENSKPDEKLFSEEYDIISVHNTGTEYLVLFRKRIGAIPAKFVQVLSLDDSFTWIENVKQELKNGQKLVLYAQGEHLSGLTGFINCLRREPGGEGICGVLIADISAPPFNPDLELYEQQINKDLAINVYLNGQWGSYRHILLEDLNTVKAAHGYVSTLTVGDLSSLTWVEGPLKENYEFKNNDSVLIHVYCSALNFHDIMTATGRMTVNVAAEGRLNQNCMQGFEVVGRQSDGSRVMAIVRENAIANLVEGDKALTWRIPDEWSFEEAATVPVAYCTVFYAMILIGKMQPGESILIHAGSGGVGQAAINVALHYECEVFTTVGTPEKRAFIKKRFPQLKDSNIGNSRDTSFEELIRRETKGKGVDLVLNCLADDKLQASIRCLGYRGRFLEIGNYDISNNTPIGMQFFLKETSFHGILLDYVLNQNNGIKKELEELLLGGIKNGSVKPLTYCTFEKHEVEAAFRYMAAGKHIGKVVVKIREEEKSRKPVKPSDYPLDVVPRYICHEDNVYIIIGGLGGFGLELADWLIMRGARKLVLSSRRGISNGYQAYRVKAWSGYGVDIKISTHDVTTAEGCEETLKMAKKRGNVQTIFNLAAVLKDALFQNQTPETFKIAFAPKVKATLHLDKLSRKLCPELQDFVVFSSVSAGLGNAGQTNYGMANTIMENICEQRKKMGLPALAIQWGAIGDVGLVADMKDENLQLEIGGTLQQRIVSCLETLEKFLKQNEPVVTSMVVAEKKIGSSGNDIIDAIAQVMGIKDLKKVPQQVPLAELGMDSMMTVEIKQCLERDFEVFLTEQDIRALTFARLIELTSERTPSSENKFNMLEGMTGLELMMKIIGNEEQAYKPYIYVPTLISGGEEIKEGLSNTEKLIFMLPGIEGSATVLEPLCRRLKAKACVLQLGLEQETFEQMIDRLYQLISTRLAPEAPFTIVAYSFGCNIALELVARLEKEGHKGLVFCIDGAPEFLYKISSFICKSLNDTELQNNIIIHTLSRIAPNSQTIENLPAKLNEIEAYEEKVAFASKICQLPDAYSTKFISRLGNACFDRIKFILKFDENKLQKIKAPIILMRCKNNFMNLDESYGLSKFTLNTVSVHLVEGNHYSILENKDVANIINKVLADEDSSKNV